MMELENYLQVPVLDSNEVKKVAQKIHSLELVWRREKLENSYTLGLLWYKSCFDGMVPYYFSTAPQYNSLLASTFPELVKAIHEIGGLYIAPQGVPVLPRSAVVNPYWHNFCFDICLANETKDSDYKDQTDPSGAFDVPHLDFQGLEIYPEMMFDKNTRMYSAILAIELPESGGGLRIFPKRFIGSDFAAPSVYRGANGDVNFEHVCRGEVVAPVTLEYLPGTVTIFDSFMPHLVEDGVYNKENPRRIVMIVHYLYRELPFPHVQFWC
jgi:hypothetical protein